MPVSDSTVWGVCQTNTDSKFAICLNVMARQMIHPFDVKKTKRHAPLPIGRTARVAFEIDAMRSECCKAAQLLLSKNKLDEVEFEECARLDEALARAQGILKAAVKNIMLSRIHRRSRTGRKR